MEIKKDPCWFYNNGGCKNKDGTIKNDKDCKFQHIFTNKCVKPTHVYIKKPCDKYNLEGSCNWINNCKYSHDSIISEEWEKYYPNIPFIINVNIKKRIELETRIHNLEEQLTILKYKQECMQKDFENILNVIENKD